jgi:hypothetical protein
LAAGQPVAAAWLGLLALILVLLAQPSYGMHAATGYSSLRPRHLVSSFYRMAAMPPRYEMERTTRVLQRDCLTDGGSVLASWHHATPLTYAVKHILPRPDVDVVYVHPEGAEPIGETWRRRADETDGPVISTNRSREMIDGDVPLWPIGGSPFFGAAAGLCPVADFDMPPMDTVFDNLVRLDAVAHVYGKGTASFRTVGEVTASFRAVGEVAERLTVVAQLVDRETGSVWGQTDHTFSAARWSDPRGLVDRLEIVPYRGAECASSDVVLGVYRSTPDGPRRLAPTEADRDAYPEGVVVGRHGLVEPLQPDGWVMRNGHQLCPAEPVDHGGTIPFGLEMTLVGSSVHRADSQIVVDLNWLAGSNARHSDYVVSAQVHGDGWRAQHDGVPAMGAIPTLKWMPGMEVHDRHRIDLPEGLPDDAPYHVTVGVYDGFTHEPLPVLDPERVQRGEGQAAEIYGAP